MVRLAPWYERNAFALERVFKAFDRNEDGAIEFRELMSGMSVLTKGTKDEKMRMCFESFDIDGSGFVDKGEMELMLDAVYKMMYRGEHVRVDLKEKVDLIFDNVDINPRDGRLSFDEFKNAATIEPLLLQCFSVGDQRKTGMSTLSCLVFVLHSLFLSPSLFFLCLSLCLSPSASLCLCLSFKRPDAQRSPWLNIPLCVFDAAR